MGSMPKRGDFGKAEMAPNDGASPAQGIERVPGHLTGGGFGIVGRLTRNATKIQGVCVVYVYCICTLCGSTTASKLLILRSA